MIQFSTQSKLIPGLVIFILALAPQLVTADVAENTALIAKLQPKWNEKFWRQQLSVSLAPTHQPVEKDGRIEDPEKVIICTSEEIKAGLDTWVSEGSILNPSTTAVWPGALLVGDHQLARGLPTPLILPRGELTISVDLNGLSGPESTRTIKDPNNTNVKNAVNEMVDYWLNNKSGEWAPRLTAFSQAQKAYSEQQIGVDMGFSAQWSSGSASASMKANSSETETVVLQSFKQIYFTVEITDAGESGSFFANDYTLTSEDVNQTRPPVYIRSVDYGRMLIAQMKISENVSEEDAEAAMSYAGGITVSGNVSVKVKNVAKNSQFRVIAVGGGAEKGETVELLNGDFKEFGAAVKNNFVFSKKSPAGPLAYTVVSLDRVFRKLNATTKYTQQTCKEYPHQFVRFQGAGAFVSFFTVSWRHPSGPKFKQLKLGQWKSGEVASPYDSGKVYIPGDAQQIDILGQNYTGLIGNDSVRTPLHMKQSDLKKGNNCWRLAGTTTIPFVANCVFP